MVALGVGQKPIVMPSYPHMMAMDIEVWSKYLADPVASIKEVWYDVHVGESVKGIPAGDELTQRVAAGVTRKRIDVVAKVGGGYWVIEVKPYANMMALGQILTYSRLFTAEYRPDGEVIPVVVCDSVDLDLINDFENMGVLLITVE